MATFDSEDIYDDDENDDDDDDNGDDDGFHLYEVLWYRLSSNLTCSGEFSSMMMITMVMMTTCKQQSHPPYQASPVQADGNS